VDQGPPHVKVFNGTTAAADFFAFDPASRGGVRVGIGDVNGDGVLDYIAGTGGGPQVKVIDGSRANQLLPDGEIADSALLANFDAFPGSAGRSGVFVTAGDFDHDGKAEVAVSTATSPESRARVVAIAGGNATQVSGPLGNFVAALGVTEGGVATLRVLGAPTRPPRDHQRIDTRRTPRRPVAAFRLVQRRAVRGQRRRSRVPRLHRR
jgi:hypothetical protein